MPESQGWAWWYGRQQSLRHHALSLAVLGMCTTAAKSTNIRARTARSHQFTSVTRSHLSSGTGAPPKMLTLSLKNHLRSLSHLPATLWPCCKAIAQDTKARGPGDIGPPAQSRRHGCVLISSRTFYRALAAAEMASPLSHTTNASLRCVCNGKLQMQSRRPPAIPCTALRQSVLGATAITAIAVGAGKGRSLLRTSQRNNSFAARRRMPSTKVP